jgi:hypothetical protein
MSTGKVDNQKNINCLDKWGSFNDKSVNGFFSLKESNGRETEANPWVDVAFTGGDTGGNIHAGGLDFIR